MLTMYDIFVKEKYNKQRI